MVAGISLWTHQVLRCLRCLKGLIAELIAYVRHLTFKVNCGKVESISSKSGDVIVLKVS